MGDVTDLSRVGVVVLAAGAAKRFGAPKLAAVLEGRPLLQHVLDMVRGLAPGCRVVVLGTDADVVEAAVRWTDEVRVHNPKPLAGLAGSVRIGVLECLRLLPDAAGVMVVLGDQPRTTPAVMIALVQAMPEASAHGSWGVIPDYADGGGANPALLLPAGLARIDSLNGDRGFGALFAADPGRAFRVAVPGTNPDVDDRADLEALART